MYLQKTKTLIQKYTCATMFIEALFIIAKIWKQPKCLSIDEWINKMIDIYYIHIIYIYTHTYIHIYNGILLRREKEWNFAVWNNMDGHGGYYAKWNKSDRERQTLYDITYMWHLKNTTN